MTSTAATMPTPRARPRAELVLAVLALATFVLVPIRINTVYDGLPAHPLFLHVPVILIPLVAIAALVLVVRPSWFVRHGVWITGLTVLALASTDLTMSAGSALRRDLHLTGGFGDAAIIARHAHAAAILRLLLILFTAVLLLALMVFRGGAAAGTAGSSGPGRLAGRIRTTPPLAAGLRVLLAVLAAACLYFVFHVGDLGAKAVWQGRLGPRNGRGFGFPGGGPGGGGFPGGGSPGGGLPGGGRFRGGPPGSGG